MTWSHTFAGTRHEIIQQINGYELPTDAHPEQAVRQFIAAQLPTPEEDTEPKREYSVAAGGGVSESDGHRSNNIFVSVSRGQVREDPPSPVPVKVEESDPA